MSDGDEPGGDGNSPDGGGGGQRPCIAGPAAWGLAAMGAAMNPAAMEIALMAAVADNGVIGRGNALPWHLPADLRYFKRTTMGKPVLMGRRTWQSIDGRPLPGRTNLVMSRQPDFAAAGAQVVADLDAALALARQLDPKAAELMVLGGADIYRLALPRAARLYLTEVHGEVAGDTRFPDWDRADWREVSRERHAADADHAWDYSFAVYERRAVG